MVSPHSPEKKQEQIQGAVAITWLEAPHLSICLYGMCLVWSEHGENWRKTAKNTSKGDMVINQRIKGYRNCSYPSFGQTCLCPYMFVMFVYWLRGFQHLSTSLQIRYFRILQSAEITFFQSARRRNCHGQEHRFTVSWPLTTMWPPPSPR